MKFHKKFSLTIIAIFCCFSLTMCENDDATAVSAVNVLQPSQNSTGIETTKKIKTDATSRNTTAINTTSAQVAKTIVESKDPVSPDYFDDVVFVGDSVSEGLRRYVAYQKETFDTDYFGDAEFLTAVNFGVYNALEGNNLPVYRGKKIPIEENIDKMNVKKVYILLGLNDLYFDTDELMKNYQELINRILAKKPDLKIVIESITPITRSEESQILNGQASCLNRKNVNAANKALKKMADENNYFFLDVWSVLADSEGFLPDSYSADGTCHMVSEAFDLWINYLRTHTIKS